LQDTGLYIKQVIFTFMPRATERSLDIQTIVVDGTEDAFKTALRRSILGVTFRRNNRYGAKFYQHKNHNAAIVEHTCEWLYEYLLAKNILKNMRQFKLKTKLKVTWDSTGKIIKISDIKSTIYLEIGDVEVQELQIYEELEKVKIDLFFSNIDAASPVLREQIRNLIENKGATNFIFNEYDFMDRPKNDDYIKSYEIYRVPTVVINDKKFINPDAKELQARMQAAFAPKVQAIDANFTLGKGISDILSELGTQIKKINSQ
jgi:hypothetical protein